MATKSSSTHYKNKLIEIAQKESPLDENNVYYIYGTALQNGITKTERETFKFIAENFKFTKKSYQNFLLNKANHHESYNKMSHGEVFDRELYDVIKGYEQLRKENNNNTINERDAVKIWKKFVLDGNKVTEKEIQTIIHFKESFEKKAQKYLNGEIAKYIKKD